MARNEEKAMAMLNRWVKMKRTLNQKPKEKRPHNPSHCTTVSDSEQWRQSIIRELVKKVSEI